MITRDLYLHQLGYYIDKPFIKIIITGIRRSGKSTVLLLLRDKLLEQSVKTAQIIYVNFESFAYANLTTAESLYGYIASLIREDKKNYLLLDEIQEVKDWEKCINSLMIDFQVDIYLTGSNSHLLSSELATFLAGRYVEIPVYTLSFREYLQFCSNYNKKETTLAQSFIRYLRLGGFLPSYRRIPGRDCIQNCI
jgi:predicted AAA+ superfamily ATPase